MSFMLVYREITFSLFSLRVSSSFTTALNAPTATEKEHINNVCCEKYLGLTGSERMELCNRTQHTHEKLAVLAPFIERNFSNK